MDPDGASADLRAVQNQVIVLPTDLTIRKGPFCFSNYIHLKDSITRIDMIVLRTAKEINSFSKDVFLTAGPVIKQHSKQQACQCCVYCISVSTERKSTERQLQSVMIADFTLPIGTELSCVGPGWEAGWWGATPNLVWSGVEKVGIFRERSRERVVGGLQLAWLFLLGQEQWEVHHPQEVVV